MSKDDSRWRPPEGAQSDSSRAGDGKKLSARATSADLPGVSPQRDVAPTLDTDDALRFVPPADDEAGGTRAHTGASAQADPSTGHAPTPDTPRAYPMAELLKYAPPRPKAFRKRATTTKATTGTKRTVTTKHASASATKRATASATKRATAIKRTNAATATPTTTKRPTAAEATSASTAWEVLPSPTPSALTLKYRNKKAIERAKLLFYIILSVLSGIAYLVHAFTATPDPVAPPNMPFTGPTTPTVRLQGYSGTAHNTHALSPAWAAGVSTVWTIPLPSGVATVTHPMYVDGSTLYVAFGVAAHSDRSTYTIAAYDLSSRTPRALWATPVSTDTPAALANDRPAFASDDDQIFFRSAILDKATGKQTSAPWGKDVPIASTENIVVTCSTTTTCSGWTQEGDEWTNLWTTSTATQTGKLRDNDLGYAPANTVVSGSAEHTSVLVPTASTEFPQIIDAHTGELTTLADPDGNATDQRVQVAADGFVLYDNSTSRGVIFDSDGIFQSTFTAQTNLPVPSMDGTYPTTSQIQAFMTQGRAEWATGTVRLTDSRECTLEVSLTADGSTREVPVPSAARLHMVNGCSFTPQDLRVSADGSSLFVRSFSPKDATSYAIATADGSSSSLRRLTQATSLTWVFDDLLIGISGDEIVAFTPPTS